MTDPHETLTRIRKQADAATEGPWEWEGKSDEMWPQGENSLMATAGAEPEVVLMAWGYDAYGITAERDEDAEFIAAARTDVPRLVDALQAVLDLHERMQNPTGDYCNECFPNHWDWPCPTVETITAALNGGNA